MFLRGSPPSAPDIPCEHRFASTRPLRSEREVTLFLLSRGLLGFVKGAIDLAVLGVQGSLNGLEDAF